MDKYLSWGTWGTLFLDHEFTLIVVDRETHIILSLEVFLLYSTQRHGFAGSPISDGGLLSLQSRGLPITQHPENTDRET